MLFHEPVAGLVDLYLGVLPENPRFIPDHALLLYLITPLTVCAAVIFLLSPGMLLALLTGDSTNISDFILRAFLAGFLLRISSNAIPKLFGLTVTPEMFIQLEVLTLVALLGLLWRKRNNLAHIPWTAAREGWRLVRLLLLPAVFVVFFIPEFFWSDIIGDGFETLYSGISLSSYIIPRFATPTGVYGLGIGLLSHAYPVFWMVNLFGYTEFAARLPIALYLVPLSAAFIALAEWHSCRRLTRIEELALFLGISSVIVTLGLNSSYFSYSTDFAAPLAVECLTVLAFAAIIYMGWTGRTGCMIGYATLAFFNRPSTNVILGFLIIASFLARDTGWQRRIIGLSATIAICMISGYLYEQLFLANFVVDKIEGYGTRSLLDRVRFLRFDDFRRLLYVLIPAGFLPGLALFAYPKQDVFARQVTILVLLYFGLFYIRAYYSLHHFAPVMLLPLVVLWRILLQRDPKALITVATIGALVLAIRIAIPTGYKVAREGRDLAYSIDFRIGVVGGSLRDTRRLFQSTLALNHVFPSLWQNVKPEEKRIIETGQLIAYHSSSRQHPTIEPNYRVQYTSDPPPENWHRGAGTGKLDDGRLTVAYIRDLDLWQQQVNNPPSAAFASPVYAIPAASMHFFLDLGRQYQMDLASTSFFWRFFRND
ncbi:MAG: hypothetical protein ACRERU_20445 [Methylococcales bacterium]